MSLPFRASDIERTIERKEHVQNVMRARRWRGLDEGFTVHRPGDLTSSRVVQVVCFDRGGRL